MPYGNPFIALVNNHAIWVSLFACFSAQLLKMLIPLAITRKATPALLFTTGGMPSSHSALVCALATAAGLQYGMQSMFFALALMFAVVVMHDAAGVRRAAGKQAEVINMLVERLDSQGITLDAKLKELLGHSPIEVVAGALWGVLIATVTFVLIV